MLVNYVDSTVWLSAWIKTAFENNFSTLTLLNERLRLKACPQILQVQLEESVCPHGYPTACHTTSTPL